MLVLLGLGFGSPVFGTESSASLSGNSPAQANSQGQADPLDQARIFIREYRVQGARHLSPLEIETAVYPWLGPARTAADVESAREALEKAYREKGYQTVLVEVPPQQGRGGIVRLKVTEQTVGRLRVNGARYYLPSQIKAKAPSMAEGSLLCFNDVSRDILALNKSADLRVTPSLVAGKVPGTVDVNLEVKDSLPLHGSLELNNRYSTDTKPLRINASLSYNNLWQLGHSIGASAQVSPEDLSQVAVYSGYYLLRFAQLDWLSLLIQGSKQDSNVSTLGSLAVAGRGEVLGFRFLVSLPQLSEFSQSLSAGLDYKHYQQNLIAGINSTATPITYLPVTANYSALWSPKGSVTELNAGVNLGIRGTGSGPGEFDASRYQADGAFVYFRGDLAHTRELPAGAQAYGKIQAQVANKPLVSNEQFAGGGLGSARGYLEAEAMGDNALFGSVELRTPSLLGWMKNAGAEWRLYAFCDAGLLTLNQPLPEQDSRIKLASVGVGTRLRLFDHLNGSLDVGHPLIGLSPTRTNDLLLTFRLWGDF